MLKKNNPQSIATHQLLLLHPLRPYVVPSGAYVGPLLGLYWAILSLCWAIFGLCKPILDLSWGPLLAHLGVHFAPFALTRAHDSKISDYASRRRHTHYRHNLCKIPNFAFHHYPNCVSSTPIKSCKCNMFEYLARKSQRNSGGHPAASASARAYPTPWRR